MLKRYINKELQEDKKSTKNIRKSTWLKGSPQVFSLAVNPPLVDSIKLQGRAMAGFLVYPHKVGLLFADEGKSTFEWFVSSERLKEEEDAAAAAAARGLQWTRRAEGFFYTTSQDDVGRALKVVCTPRDSSGKVMK